MILPAHEASINPSDPKNRVFCSIHPYNYCLLSLSPWIEPGAFNIRGNSTHAPLQENLFKKKKNDSHIFELRH